MRTDLQNQTPHARGTTRTRLVLIFSICILSVLLWERQAGQNTRLREMVARQQHAFLNLQRVIATEEESLKTSRQSLEKARAFQAETAGAIVKSERTLDQKTDPDLAWTEPPAALPEWSELSPFVWLRKDLLATLSMDVFAKDGQLRSDITSLFRLDPEKRYHLNSQLSGVMAKYHSLEAAHAELTEDHLAGVGDTNDQRITIRVNPLPEEGAQLKREFEDLLRHGLGSQRADVALKSGRSWLDQQFGTASTDTRTISAARHGDGSYSISVKTAGTWMSTSGPNSLKDYVPTHLIHFFDPIRPAQKLPTASALAE